MKRIIWMALLALPGVASAQDPSVAAASAEAKRGDILSALELPRRAQALRDDGVPADEVSQALTASMTRGVSAAEAEETFERAHEDARDHGHIHNFGDFVQARLDEGLRGQDLAAAIHAEHAARGVGKPDHAGKPKPDHDDDDHDDDHDDAHGRPSDAPMTRPSDAPMTRPTPQGGSR